MNPFFRSPVSGIGSAGTRVAYKTVTPVSHLDDMLVIGLGASGPCKTPTEPRSRRSGVFVCVRYAGTTLGVERYGIVAMGDCTDGDAS